MYSFVMKVYQHQGAIFHCEEMAPWCLVDRQMFNYLGIVVYIAIIVCLFYRIKCF